MAAAGAGAVPASSSAGRLIIRRIIMVTAAAMRGGWFRRRGDRAGGWSIAAIERNPQSLTAKASALSGRGFSAGFREMEPVFGLYVIFIYAIFTRLRRNRATSGNHL